MNTLFCSLKTHFRGDLTYTWAKTRTLQSTHQDVDDTCGCSNSLRFSSVRHVLAASDITSRWTRPTTPTQQMAPKQCQKLSEFKCRLLRAIMQTTRDNMSVETLETRTITRDRWVSMTFLQRKTRVCVKTSFHSSSQLCGPTAISNKTQQFT